MRFLNSVKRRFSLSREVQAYIKNTASHKKVLKEANKERMSGISERQQTKQRNVAVNK